MVCTYNFNRNHYITIITISFLAVFTVLAKVLLIDYTPQVAEKSDFNSINHYYQGTVEKGISYNYVYRHGLLVNLSEN